jgi:hypothetical protein
MPLQVLESPYEAIRPAGPFPPCVGALLLADLSGGIPALAEALEAHGNFPWCPLVMIADRSIPAETLHTFEPIPGSWALLYASDYLHLPPARRARSAVQRRPIPSATTLALWVERRLALPSVASTLAACCGVGGDALRPPRTLTRRVQALGPLEVRDWRGLARLAQLLAANPRDRCSSLEATALGAGVDPRTLRRWFRLATDLCWHQCTGWVGWEWVLESALRGFGYLERREPRRVGERTARWAEV